MASSESLFQAIKSGENETVRHLLLEKSLLTSKYRDTTLRFDPDSELDAYKFLGAYLGAMSCLQYAIMCGQDTIAKDIIDLTFKEDLGETCGSGNTALHLATFLGATEVVKMLLERGALPTVQNTKGFTAVDLLGGDPEMMLIFEEYKD